jgi:large subunit ribosomal protein L13
MTTTLMKTGQVRAGWRIVDATGQSLGRMAAQLAVALMGKDKPCYTPHVDCGDYIVVVNAEKIKVDHRSKWQTKEYQNYTYYPGGLTVVPFKTVLAKHPERIVMLAVRRMLPKTSLGRAMLKKLKIYRGPEHPHANFRPVAMAIKRK